MKPTTKDYFNVAIMVATMIAAIAVGIIVEPKWIGQLAWLTSILLPLLTGGYGSLAAIGAYRRMNKMEKESKISIEKEMKEFNERLAKIFEPKVHIKEITFEEDKEEYVQIIKKLYDEAVMEEDYERAALLKKQADIYNIEL